MIADVRLGLRLARGGEAGGRLRGAAHVLAQLVGSFVMLTTLAIIRAELDTPAYERDDLGLLVLTVVATIGVPVLVLVATAGRLSAVLRDRRLANLRTLGLSRSRTRLVAAVEAGATGLAGSVLGLIVFWISRPVVSNLQVGDRDWSSSAFAPWPLAAFLVVVGLPLAAVVVALVPGAHASPAERTRTVAAPTQKRPGLWRFAVLAIGLVAVAVSTIGAAEEIDMIWLYLLMGGGVLCAVGLLLVVPVLTRLIADVMVRVPGRPSVRIAGRRLQSQPAGVSRIVAGLLIGLFVVAGGRMVIGAWEDTPQYRAADQAIHEGPADYSVSSSDGGAVEPLAALDGVLGAFENRVVLFDCEDDGLCLSCFVGTCHDLESAVPDAVGCRDDRVAWLDDPSDVPLGPGNTMLWNGASDPPSLSARAPTPGADDVITSPASTYGVGDAMQAQVFIPIGTPGMAHLADKGRGDSTPEIVVEVDPQIMSEAELRQALHQIDPRADVFPMFDETELNFVAGLRALVWAVAAVVLAIGLLGFAIATVDRSVARRSEMVSLQLVGTPRSVIRAAQWWEAALPLLLGVLLAVASGTAVGAAYLALADSYDASPWGSVVTLGAVSLAGAIGIAGLTVVACAPRIRADLIRRA